MAKYTDAIRDTIIGAFNANDQPTEAQFTNWITRIQEAIDEHDHAGAVAGDGMQLDWDNIWSDAVHSHANAGEGGATLGFTAMTGAGVTVPDGWYLGIGAALEKITFNAAGYITIDSAFFGVNFGIPAFEVHVADAGTDSQSQVVNDGYNDQTGYRPEFVLRKSHNDSKGTVTETATGSDLGAYLFKGVNSNNAWAYGALIVGKQPDAAGAVTVPTKLQFYTSDAAGNTAIALTLDTDQTAVFPDLAGHGASSAIGVDNDGKLIVL